MTEQLAIPRDTALSVQVVELNVPEPEVTSETAPVGVIAVPDAVSVIVTVQAVDPSIETGEGAQVTAVEVDRVPIVRLR